MKRREIRFTALLTLICFASSQFLSSNPLWAYSGFPSEMVGAQFPPKIVADPPRSVEEIAPLRIDLPPDLGTIDRLQSGNGPVIFHIQEAHGNLEAQQKIRKILHELKRRYGVKLVLLEGSAVKLHPELLRFYPDDMKLTLKIVDDLSRQGWVSGAQYFLAEDQETQGYGIEDLEAYNRNGKSFVEVHRAVGADPCVGPTHLSSHCKGRTRGSAPTSPLNAIDVEMRRRTARLNPRLRTFLKRVGIENVRAVREPPLPFAYLQSQAKEILDLDFADPVFQVDWPMLVRLAKLEEIEKKMDLKGFVGERGRFLKIVRPFIVGARFPRPLSSEGGETPPLQSFDPIDHLLSQPLSRHSLPDPQTSLFFEDLISRLPRNFPHHRFPNVKLFIAHLILQSELKGEVLFKEIERLTEMLQNRLAKTEEEKKIVGELRQYRLLQKLLHLELTGEEWEEIVGADPRVRPWADIGEVKGDGPTHGSAPTTQALSFYRTARERDRWMLENIEKRLKETRETKAVVITGGFHAAPFERYFKDKNYNYALITPKISSVATQDGYVQSVLKNYRELVGSDPNTPGVRPHYPYNPPLQSTYAEPGIPLLTKSEIRAHHRSEARYAAAAVRALRDHGLGRSEIEQTEFYRQFFSHGRSEARMPEFEPSPSRQPVFGPSKPKNLMELGKESLRRYHPREARGYFEGFLEISPHDPEALRYLGITLTILKEFDQARKILESLHVLQPRDPRLLRALAELEQKTGHLDRAQQFYLEAFDNTDKKNDRDAAAFILTKLGDIALALELGKDPRDRNFSAAETYYQRALGLWDSEYAHRKLRRIADLKAQTVEEQTSFPAAASSPLISNYPQRRITSDGPAFSSIIHVSQTANPGSVENEKSPLVSEPPQKSARPFGEFEGQVVWPSRHSSSSALDLERAQAVFPGHEETRRLERQALNQIKVVFVDYERYLSKAQRGNNSHRPYIADVSRFLPDDETQKNESVEVIVLYNAAHTAEEIRPIFGSLGLRHDFRGRWVVVIPDDLNVVRKATFEVHLKSEDARSARLEIPHLTHRSEARGGRAEGSTPEFKIPEIAGSGAKDPEFAVFIPKDGLAAVVEVNGESISGKLLHANGGTPRVLNPVPTLDGKNKNETLPAYLLRKKREGDWSIEDILHAKRAKVLERITAQLWDLIHESHIQAEHIKKIGILLRGPLVSTEGSPGSILVSDAKTLPFEEGLPLEAEIRRRLMKKAGTKAKRVGKMLSDVPIEVKDQALAGFEGEQRQFPDSSGNLMYVYWGSEISAVLAVKGTPFRGEAGKDHALSQIGQSLVWHTDTSRYEWMPWPVSVDAATLEKNLRTPALSQKYDVPLGEIDALSAEKGGLHFGQALGAYLKGAAHRYGAGVIPSRIFIHMENSDLKGKLLSGIRTGMKEELERPLEQELGYLHGRQKKYGDLSSLNSKDRWKRLEDLRRAYGFFYVRNYLLGLRAPEQPVSDTAVETPAKDDHAAGQAQVFVKAVENITADEAGVVSKGLGRMTTQIPSTLKVFSHARLRKGLLMHVGPNDHRVLWNPQQEILAKALQSLSEKLQVFNIHFLDIGSQLLTAGNQSRLETVLGNLISICRKYGLEIWPGTEKVLSVEGIDHMTIALDGDPVSGEMVLSIKPVKDRRPLTAIQKISLKDLSRSEARVGKRRGGPRQNVWQKSRAALRQSRLSGGGESTDVSVKAKDGPPPELNPKKDEGASRSEALPKEPPVVVDPDAVEKWATEWMTTKLPETAAGLVRQAADPRIVPDPPYRAAALIADIREPEGVLKAEIETARAGILEPILKNPSENEKIRAHFKSAAEKLQGAAGVRRLTLAQFRRVLEILIHDLVSKTPAAEEGEGFRELEDLQWGRDEEVLEGSKELYQTLREAWGLTPGGVGSDPHKAREVLFRVFAYRALLGDMDPSFALLRRILDPAIKNDEIEKVLKSGKEKDLSPFLDRVQSRLPPSQIPALTFNPKDPLAVKMMKLAARLISAAPDLSSFPGREDFEKWLTEARARRSRPILYRAGVRTAWAATKLKLLALLNAGFSVTVAGVQVPNMTGDLWKDFLSAYLTDAAFTEYLKSGRLKILSTGAPLSGTDLNHTSEEFNDGFLNANSIVTESQADHDALANGQNLSRPVFAQMEDSSGLVQFEFREPSLVPEYFDWVKAQNRKMLLWLIAVPVIFLSLLALYSFALWLPEVKVYAVVYLAFLLGFMTRPFRDGVKALFNYSEKLPEVPRKKYEAKLGEVLTREHAILKRIPDFPAWFRARTRSASVQEQFAEAGLNTDPHYSQSYTDVLGTLISMGTEGDYKVLLASRNPQGRLTWSDQLEQELAEISHLMNPAVFVLRIESKHVSAEVTLGFAFSADQTGEQRPVLLADDISGALVLPFALARRAVEDYARAKGFETVVFSKHFLKSWENRPDEKGLPHHDELQALGLELADASRPAYLQAFAPESRVPSWLEGLFYPVNFAIPKGSVTGYVADLRKAEADGPEAQAKEKTGIEVLSSPFKARVSLTGIGGSARGLEISLGVDGLSHHSYLIRDANGLRELLTGLFGEGAAAAVSVPSLERGIDPFQEALQKQIHFLSFAGNQVFDKMAGNFKEEFFISPKTGRFELNRHIIWQKKDVADDLLDRFLTHFEANLKPSDSLQVKKIPSLKATQLEYQVFALTEYPNRSSDSAGRFQSVKKMSTAEPSKVQAGDLSVAVPNADRGVSWSVSHGADRILSWAEGQLFIKVRDRLHGDDESIPSPQNPLRGFVRQGFDPAFQSGAGKLLVAVDPKMMNQIYESSGGKPWGWEDRIQYQVFERDWRGRLIPAGNSGYDYEVRVVSDTRIWDGARSEARSKIGAPASAPEKKAPEPSIEDEISALIKGLTSALVVVDPNLIPSGEYRHGRRIKDFAVPAEILDVYTEILGKRALELAMGRITSANRREKTERRYGEIMNWMRMKLPVGDLTEFQFERVVYFIVKKLANGTDPLEAADAALVKAFEEKSKAVGESWKELVKGRGITPETAGVLGEALKWTALAEETAEPGGFKRDIVTVFGEDFDRWTAHLEKTKKQPVLLRAGSKKSFVFAKYVLQILLKAGYKVTVAGNETATLSQASETWIRNDLVKEKDFHDPLKDGRLRVISTGTDTSGTDFNRTNSDFNKAFLEAGSVVSIGKDNFRSFLGEARLSRPVIAPHPPDPSADAVTFTFREPGVREDYVSHLGRQYAARLIFGAAGLLAGGWGLFYLIRFAVGLTFKAGWLALGMMPAALLFLVVYFEQNLNREVVSAFVQSLKARIGEKPGPLLEKALKMEKQVLTASENFPQHFSTRSRTVETLTRLARAGVDSALWDNPRFTERLRDFGIPAEFWARDPKKDFNEAELYSDPQKALGDLGFFENKSISRFRLTDWGVKVAIGAGIYRQGEGGQEKGILVIPEVRRQGIVPRSLQAFLETYARQAGFSKIIYNRRFLTTQEDRDFIQDLRERPDVKLETLQIELADASKPEYFKAFWHYPRLLEGLAASLPSSWAELLYRLIPPLRFVRPRGPVTGYVVDLTGPRSEARSSDPMARFKAEMQRLGEEEIKWAEKQGKEYLDRVWSKALALARVKAAVNPALSALVDFFEKNSEVLQKGSDLETILKKSHAKTFKPISDQIPRYFYLGIRLTKLEDLVHMNHDVAVIWNEEKTNLRDFVLSFIVERPAKVKTRRFPISGGVKETLEAEWGKMTGSAQGVLIIGPKLGIWNVQRVAEDKSKGLNKQVLVLDPDNLQGHPFSDVELVSLLRDSKAWKDLGLVPHRSEARTPAVLDEMGIPEKLRLLPVLYEIDLENPPTGNEIVTESLKFRLKVEDPEKTPQHLPQAVKTFRGRFSLNAKWGRAWNIHQSMLQRLRDSIAQIAGSNLSALDGMLSQDTQDLEFIWAQMPEEYKGERSFLAALRLGEQGVLFSLPKKWGISESFSTSLLGNGNFSKLDAIIPSRLMEDADLWIPYVARPLRSEVRGLWSRQSDQQDRREEPPWGWNGDGTDEWDERLYPHPEPEQPTMRFDGLFRPVVGADSEGPGSRPEERGWEPALGGSVRLAEKIETDPELSWTGFRKFFPPDITEDKEEAVEWMHSFILNLLFIPLVAGQFARDYRIFSPVYWTVARSFQVLREILMQAARQSMLIELPQTPEDLIEYFKMWTLHPRSSHRMSVPLTAYQMFVAASKLRHQSLTFLKDGNGKLRDEKLLLNKPPFWEDSPRSTTPSLSSRKLSNRSEARMENGESRYVGRGAARRETFFPLAIGGAIAAGISLWLVQPQLPDAFWGNHKLIQMTAFMAGHGAAAAILTRFIYWIFHYFLPQRAGIERNSYTHRLGRASWYGFLFGAGMSFLLMPDNGAPGIWSFDAVDSVGFLMMGVAAFSFGSANRRTHERLKNTRSEMRISVIPASEFALPKRKNIVPVDTPFKTAGGRVVVDEASAERDMKRLKEKMGVGAVLVVGATGEFQLMDPTLRKEAIRVMTRAAKKAGLQTFTGVTGASQNETEENALAAQEAGADAIVIAPLYYIQDSEEALENLLNQGRNKIEDSIDGIRKRGVTIPLALYNNPHLPRIDGRNLPENVVWDLWEKKKAVAIKDSSGKLKRVKAYILTGMPTYLGDESLIREGMNLRLGETGGLRIWGIVGSTGNLSRALQVIAKSEDAFLIDQLQELILEVRNDLTVNLGKISGTIRHLLSQGPRTVMKSTALPASKKLTPDEKRKAEQALIKLNQGLRDIENLGSQEYQRRRSVARTEAILQMRKDYDFSVGELWDTARSFQKEMEKGLRGDPSSLAMIPSHVFKLGDVKSGGYLSVDAGGSNFRALKVRLYKNGKLTAIQDKFPIPAHLKTERASAEELFDFFAESLKKFMKKRGLENRKWKSGFTFSFTMNVQGVDKAVLVEFDKDWKTRGVVRKDVVRLFREALKRKKLKRVDVAAVGNDALGLHLAAEYFYKKDRQKRKVLLAFIAGTGHNGSTLERLENIWKWKGQGKPQNEMYVVMESGGFDKFRRTREDEELDRDSENPGKQFLEKATSGGYLGELFRRVLKRRFINRGLLFQEPVPPAFENLKTRDLAAIIGDRTSRLEKIQKLLYGLGIHHSSLTDRKIIQEAARWVVGRSAKLYMMEAVAVHNRKDRLLKDRYVVPFDGPLFEEHPFFKKTARETLNEMLGEKRARRITLVSMPDASGIGTAIEAAAVSLSGRRSEARTAPDIQQGEIVVEGKRLRLVPLTQDLLRKEADQVFRLLNLIPANVIWDRQKHLLDAIGNLHDFDPELSFAVMDDQNKMAAFAMDGRKPPPYHKDREDGLYLNYMGVDDPYRGKGVAPWMLHRVFSAGKAGGLSYAHWRTRTDDPISNRFHQKIGAQWDITTLPDEITKAGHADIPNIKHNEYIGDFDGMLPKLEQEFQNRLPRSEARGWREQIRRDVLRSQQRARKPKRPPPLNPLLKRLSASTSGTLVVRKIKTDEVRIYNPEADKPEDAFSFLLVTSFSLVWKGVEYLFVLREESLNAFEDGIPDELTYFVPGRHKTDDEFTIVMMNYKTGEFDGTKTLQSVRIEENENNKGLKQAWKDKLRSLPKWGKEALAKSPEPHSEARVKKDLSGVLTRAEKSDFGAVPIWLLRMFIGSALRSAVQFGDDKVEGEFTDLSEKVLDLQNFSSVSAKILRWERLFSPAALVYFLDVLLLYYRQRLGKVQRMIGSAQSEGNGRKAHLLRQSEDGLYDLLETLRKQHPGKNSRSEARRSLPLSQEIALEDGEKVMRLDKSGTFVNANGGVSKSSYPAKSRRQVIRQSLPLLPVRHQTLRDSVLLSPFSGQDQTPNRKKVRSRIKAAIFEVKPNLRKKRLVKAAANVMLKEVISVPAISRFLEELKNAILVSLLGGEYTHKLIKDQSLFFIILYLALMKSLFHGLFPRSEARTQLWLANDQKQPVEIAPEIRVQLIHNDGTFARIGLGIPFEASLAPSFGGAEILPGGDDEIAAFSGKDGGGVSIEGLADLFATVKIQNVLSRGVNIIYEIRSKSAGNISQGKVSKDESRSKKIVAIVLRLLSQGQDVLEGTLEEAGYQKISSAPELNAGDEVVGIINPQIPQRRRVILGLVDRHFNFSEQEGEGRWIPSERERATSVSLKGAPEKLEPALDLVYRLRRSEARSLRAYRPVGPEAADSAAPAAAAKKDWTPQDLTDGFKDFVSVLAPLVTRGQGGFEIVNRSESSVSWKPKKYVERHREISRMGVNIFEFQAYTPKNSEELEGEPENRISLTLAPRRMIIQKGEKKPKDPRTKIEPAVIEMDAHPLEKVVIDSNGSSVVLTPEAVQKLQPYLDDLKIESFMSPMKFVHHNLSPLRSEARSHDTLTSLPWVKRTMPAWSHVPDDPFLLKDHLPANLKVGSVALVTGHSGILTVKEGRAGQTPDPVHQDLIPYIKRFMAKPRNSILVMSKVSMQDLRNAHSAVPSSLNTAEDRYSLRSVNSVLERTHAIVSETKQQKASIAGKFLEREIFPGLAGDEAAVVFILGNGQTDHDLLQIRFPDKPRVVVVPVFMKDAHHYTGNLPNEIRANVKSPVYAVMDILNWGAEFQGKAVSSAGALPFDQWQPDSRSEARMDSELPVLKDNPFQRLVDQLRQAMAGRSSVMAKIREKNFAPSASVESVGLEIDGIGIGRVYSDRPGTSLDTKTWHNGRALQVYPVKEDPSQQSPKRFKFSLKQPPEKIDAALVLQEASNAHISEPPTALEATVTGWRDNPNPILSGWIDAIRFDFKGVRGTLKIYLPSNEARSEYPKGKRIQLYVDMFARGDPDSQNPAVREPHIWFVASPEEVRRRRSEMRMPYSDRSGYSGRRSDPGSYAREAPANPALEELRAAYKASQKATSANRVQSQGWTGIKLPVFEVGITEIGFSSSGGREEDGLKVEYHAGGAKVEGFIPRRYLPGYVEGHPVDLKAEYGDKVGTRVNAGLVLIIGNEVPIFQILGTLDQAIQRTREASSRNRKSWKEALAELERKSEEGYPVEVILGDPVPGRDALYALYGGVVQGVFVIPHHFRDRNLDGFWGIPRRVFVDVQYDASKNPQVTFTDRRPLSARSAWRPYRSEIRQVKAAFEHRGKTLPVRWLDLYSDNQLAEILAKLLGREVPLGFGEREPESVVMEEMGSARVVVVEEKGDRLLLKGSDPNGVRPQEKTFSGQVVATSKFMEQLSKNPRAVAVWLEAARLSRQKIVVAGGRSILKTLRKSLERRSELRAAEKIEALRDLETVVEVKPRKALAEYFKDQRFGVVALVAEGEKLRDIPVRFEAPLRRWNPKDYVLVPFMTPDLRKAADFIRELEPGVQAERLRENLDRFVPFARFDVRSRHFVTDQRLADFVRKLAADEQIDVAA